MRLVTVSEKFNAAAEATAEKLRAAGLRVDLDLTGDKLGAKIRRARMLRLPYIGVIGEKEAERDGIALRSRDENEDLGFMPTSEVIARILRETLPPSRRSE